MKRLLRLPVFLFLFLAPTYPPAAETTFNEMLMVDVRAPSQQEITDAKILPISVVAGGGSAAAGRHPLPRPQTEPVAFLEACLKHYDNVVHGYTVRFEKRERVYGKQLSFESVEVMYRDHPHSVLFHWLQPADSRALGALYVEGANQTDGKSRVKLFLRKSVFKNLDFLPRSKELMDYSRYPMSEFGMRQGMQRVLNSWKAAAKENALHVEYLGLNKTNLTGDAVCHVFQRTQYAQPEEIDRVAGVKIFIDCMTLLQVGCIVLGEHGEKDQIAEYFFRDIRLNPQFAPDQFTPETLNKLRG
jgi:hypothetical protein